MGEVKEIFFERGSAEEKLLAIDAQIFLFSMERLFLNFIKGKMGRSIFAIHLWNDNEH